MPQNQLEHEFGKVRSLLERFRSQWDQKYIDDDNADVVFQFSSSKKESRHQRQVQVLSEKLHQQSEQCSRLQMTVKKLSEDQNNRIQVESKAQMQLIAEKDKELQAQRRQIGQLKIKITSLESENSAARNERLNSEIVVSRNIECLKNYLQDLAVSLEAVELEKSLIESKFNRIGEEVTRVLEENQRVTSKSKVLQDRLQKLGTAHNELNSQYIRLQFESGKVQFNKIDSAQPSSTLLAVFAANESSLMTLQKMASLLESLKEKDVLMRQLETTYESLSALERANQELHREVLWRQALLEQYCIEQRMLSADDILRMRKPDIYLNLEKKCLQMDEYSQNLAQIQSYINERDEEIRNAINVISMGPEGLKDSVENKLLRQKVQTLQQDKRSFEELTVVYKKELTELIEIYEIGKRKKPKRRKVRCEQCLVPAEQEDSLVKCIVCPVFTHPKCQASHTCRDPTVTDQ